MRDGPLGGLSERSLRTVPVGDLRLRVSRRGDGRPLLPVASWSSQRWLHRLRQPTLVLQGDDDPLIPLVNARWMSHRLPDARLHVVKGAGHLFLVDDPEQVVGTIQDFLA